MAAPEGIRQFPDQFDTDEEYDLNQCFRCGEEILDAASELIESSPSRARSGTLTAASDHSGKFEYARFPGNRSEAKGVAEMIEARHEQGVPLEDIVVLVRSSVSDWIGEIGPELDKRRIDYVNPDRVDSILEDDSLTRNIEIARIAACDDYADSLAWWILLDVINGVSSEFRDYIYQSAVDNDSTFAEELLRLCPDFKGSPTERSARAAVRAVKEITQKADEIDSELEDVDLGESGWGGWILDHFGREKFSQEQTNLLQEVGDFLGNEVTLQDFLGKLEPVAKDLATDADAVRVMTITKSKGLTVDSVFVMGVEEGIIPRVDALKPEEERRLLYVAITRATDLCVLSYANHRRGPTARHGEGTTGQSRGRSPLIQHLSIGNWRPGDVVVDEVKNLA
jgi:superfamily I DNA/RNA helicase